MPEDKCLEPDLKEVVRDFDLAASAALTDLLSLIDNTPRDPNVRIQGNGYPTELNSVGMANAIQIKTSIEKLQDQLNKIVNNCDDYLVEMAASNGHKRLNGSGLSLYFTDSLNQTVSVKRS